MTKKDNTKTPAAKVTGMLPEQGCITGVANSPEEAMKLIERLFGLNEDRPAAGPEDGPLLFAYTRRMAIDDGVLIDVTTTAAEAGFRIPVAVTPAVWAECIAVPAGVSGQDEGGRLWDVLSMLRFAIRGPDRDGSDVRYRLHVRNDNRDGTPPLVELKAVCGPADDGAPCVTVMTPTED